MKKIILTMASTLTLATSAFAQIGSINKDMVFTPVNPCRLFDTRSSQGGTGAIAAAGVKNLLVWGQSSYTAQGGAPSDCDLLAAGSNVAAVAINLTVVSPATGGYITAYPFGTVLPTAATVNFVGGDIVRGNFTVAKINQGAGLFHLTIYSTSLADVVGDVVGYYSKPVATALECVNTAANSADINLGPNNGLYYNYLFGGAPACPTGYTFVNLRCFTSSAFSPGFEHNSGGCAASSPVNTTTLFAQAKCCRIPGR
jgi:hypothetical protein